MAILIDNSNDALKNIFFKEQFTKGAILPIKKSINNKQNILLGNFQ